MAMRSAVDGVRPLARSRWTLRVETFSSSAACATEPGPENIGPGHLKIDWQCIQERLERQAVRMSAAAAGRRRCGGHDRSPDTAIVKGSRPTSSRALLPTTF